MENETRSGQRLPNLSDPPLKGFNLSIQFHFGDGRTETVFTVKERDSIEALAVALSKEPSEIAAALELMRKKIIQDFRLAY